MGKQYRALRFKRRALYKLLYRLTYCDPKALSRGMILFL
jgi:hypothetical protein